MSWHMKALKTLITWTWRSQSKQQPLFTRAYAYIISVYMACFCHFPKYSNRCDKKKSSVYSPLEWNKHKTGQKNAKDK